MGGDKKIKFNPWIISISVIIITLSLIGSGIIYQWQNSVIELNQQGLKRRITTLESELIKTEKTRKALQEEITNIQAKITSLSKEGNNTDINNKEQKTNEFSLKRAKVGDKVGWMTIRFIRQFIKIFENLPINNASIYFTGKTTLTGKYEVFENSKSSEICFYPSLESRINIPKIYGDNKTNWFCFSNPNFTKKLLGAQEREATIVIDNYTINAYPGEIFNTAELIQVIRKGAISENP